MSHVNLEPGHPERDGALPTLAQDPLIEDRLEHTEDDVT
jgi:hypothetical protein